MRWLRRRFPPAPEGDPVAEPLPSDPALVFRALARHGVEYAVIGGLAVQAHGHLRTTRDVDIVTDPSPGNLVRLAAALKELDARLLGVDAHLLGIDPTDPRALEAGASWTLATAGGRLDVFSDPAELKGSAPWPEMRERSLALDVLGVAVRVVGLDDLRMKIAAGRPQDLADLAVLTDPAGS